MRAITRHQNQQSLTPHTIAYCPNNNMVISYWEPGQKVFLYGPDGKYKMQLVSDDEDEEKQSGFVMSMAVSSLGYIIIISLYDKDVRVFDIDGTYVTCFSVLAPDEDQSMQVHPKCVAVDQNGCVLIGDRVRKLITIHECPDGTLLRRVQCQDFEDRLTVNCNDQILYSCKSMANSKYDKIVATDYSGKEVFTFTPCIPTAYDGTIDPETESRRVVVEGIVCDSHNMIYVIMQVCDRYDRVPNTGHLHQYSPIGEFIRCIQSDIDDPNDLAIANEDELIVTNHEAILVYRSKKY